MIMGRESMMWCWEDLRRWTASSESYYSTSPYAYCGNNPVNRIDPTGADWYEDKDGNLYWQEAMES